MVVHINLAVLMLANALTRANSLLGSPKNHTECVDMEAIKQLKSLARVRMEEKHPTVPKHAIAIRSYTDKTANGLTKCIIDWLKFHNHQAERINCTGRMIDSRQTVIDVAGRVQTIGYIDYILGLKDTNVIVATILGQPARIEIKFGKNRQSDHPFRYRVNGNIAGSMYILGWNFDGFVQWYDLVCQQSECN